MCTSCVSSSLSQILHAAWCILFSSRVAIPHCSFSDCPHSSQNGVLYRPPYSLYPSCLQELLCGCPADHADSLCPETCSASFLLGQPCSCAPTVGGGTVTCPLLRTSVPSSLVDPSLLPPSPALSVTCQLLSILCPKSCLHPPRFFFLCIPR